MFPVNEKGFKIKVLSRTVRKLSYWPWDDWKYDMNLLVKKLKEFEKQENGKDYVVYEDKEPAMVFDVVEAKRE